MMTEKNNKQTKRVSVYLTEEQFKRLRQIAFDKEITHSELVREALNDKYGGFK